MPGKAQGCNACQKTKNQPNKKLHPKHQKKLQLIAFLSLTPSIWDTWPLAGCNMFAAFSSGASLSPQYPPKYSRQGLTGPFSPVLLQWYVRIRGQWQTDTIRPGSLREDISVLNRVGKSRKEYVNPLFSLNQSSTLRMERYRQAHVSSRKA